MASSFYALDVKSGESFLLQTDQGDRKWNILVDSGHRKGRGKKHPLVQAICDIGTNIDSIDIAICTHQDADHSAGFHTFADAWCTDGRTIGEYWLPGRWAAALPTVLTDPATLIDWLYEGAFEAAEQVLLGGEEEDVPLLGTIEERLRGVAPIEKIAEAFSCIEDASVKSPSDVARSLGLETSELEAVLRDVEETDHSIVDSMFREALRREHIWLRTSWFFLHAKKPHVSILTHILFRHAVETVQSIRSIALSAIRHKIRIRWFDFGLFDKAKQAKGGEREFLLPLCAVELRAPPRVVDPSLLFFSLALSRQNVESLAFYRMETESEPGVLFLGDSRLAFGISQPTKDFPMPPNKPRRRIIATAPHHGSRVNDHAYGVISAWLNGRNDTCFIRNGGHWKQTLGLFKQFKDRRCVRCHQCSLNAHMQQIEIRANTGNWVWPPKNGSGCP